jgi:hypothetical protein
LNIHLNSQQKLIKINISSNSLVTLVLMGASKPPLFIFKTLRKR